MGKAGNALAGGRRKHALRKPYERQTLGHEKDQSEVVADTFVVCDSRRSRKSLVQEQKRFFELYQCDATRLPLGSGSQGIVRLCTVKKTGEAVVCKTVKSNTPTTKLKARREASIHRRCSSHPLVATLHDAMEIKGSMHMVMEYCNGGTLTDLIDEYHPEERPPQEGTSPMPPELAAHVINQLAKALSYIHGQGIAHRDIKGENIMMMSDKRSIRLVDFGMAVAVDFNPACQDVKEDIFRRWCCGTEGFVAPEVLRFEAARTALDIWSAGALLFLMLTGEMPFAHLPDKKLTRQDCSSEIHFSIRNIPEQAKHLVLCMLDFNPKTRITAQEIMEHPWIIQSLKMAVPCKEKQWLDLCHLQDLSMWLKAIEAQQRTASLAMC